MVHFHVSQTTAMLRLSLYIIGYGIGPLFFSPLSEIPSIGRTSVYIVTLFLFVVLQLPTIYARNMNTVLAIRRVACARHRRRVHP
jgi:DHA1 family multidrug resistance protein-like MFS transporter